MLNFAGKGTISAAKNTIKKPILTLEKDSQAAIDWFNIHKMIVNPDKFQVIVLKKGFAEWKIPMTYKSATNQTINSENCKKLQLHNVEQYISNFCKKPNNQLNVTSRIQMGFKAMLQQKIEHFLKKHKYEKLGLSEMN